MEDYFIYNEKYSCLSCCSDRIISPSSINCLKTVATNSLSETPSSINRSVKDWTCSDSKVCIISSLICYSFTSIDLDWFELDLGLDLGELRFYLYYLDFYLYYLD